ncbi:hypothetical protein TNCT_22991 [Trichonephila clavata]|uniref:Uncharacterized protein n=1 Tax=Trichonephila clavata TaxID=2740835 RepID=A0A8X6M583_TRICU|nr:hypothetical protein TNCT_22991 [Trichonephila clavata]
MNEKLYQVTRENSFVKGLTKMPEIYHPAIEELIGQLEVNPFTVAEKNLSGVHKGYIKRIGGWRVIYIVDKNSKIVKLVKVAPRKNAYK